MYRPNYLPIALTCWNEYVVCAVEGIVSPIFDGQQKIIGHALLPVQTAQPTNDYVYNYGVSLLEIGLLFTSLLDVIHFPHRDRGLRLMKMSLMFFRSHSTHSKYAYEIVRFLMHQYCTLSAKRAHEEFFGLFVNTTDRVGGNIPCDLLMEHHVRNIKWNVKHMNSGANEEFIKQRCAANGPLSEIGCNFDVEVNTLSITQSCDCYRRSAAGYRLVNQSQSNSVCNQSLSFFV